MSSFVLNIGLSVRNLKWRHIFVNIDITRCKSTKQLYLCVGQGGRVIWRVTICLIVTRLLDSETNPKFFMLQLCPRGVPIRSYPIVPFQQQSYYNHASPCAYERKRDRVDFRDLNIYTISNNFPTITIQKQSVFTKFKNWKANIDI